MFRWKIEIFRQVLIMLVRKTFFRAHPPENCPVFHSRTFHQILMFIKKNFLQPPYSGSDTDVQRLSPHTLPLQIPGSFLPPSLTDESSDRGLRYVSYPVPPSALYEEIFTSPEQIPDILPYVQFSNCFCSRSVLLLPEAVAVQIIFLYHQISVSCHLLEASAHCKI